MRCASRATSSATCSMASSSCAGVRFGRRASSSSVWSTASGVRSSWPASATNARCRSSAPWRRARSSFIVVASAAISSWVVGTGRRAAASCSEMSAASRRIRSTGRNAADASNHAPTPATTIAAAPPTSRPRSTRGTAVVGRLQRVGDHHDPSTVLGRDRLREDSVRLLALPRSCTLLKTRRVAADLITPRGSTGASPASRVDSSTWPSGRVPA